MKSQVFISDESGSSKPSCETFPEIFVFFSFFEKFRKIHYFPNTGVWLYKFSEVSRSRVLQDTYEL